MIRRIDGGARPTRTLPTGPYAEHPHVAQTLAALAERAKAGGSSSIMFLPAGGVRYEAYAFAYQTKLPKQMNIPSPPKGPLRGTLVVNASGHRSGDVVDRATGFALAHGLAAGDDALRFCDVRASCASAVAALARDPARAAVVVDGVVELPRTLYDKLKRASVDSADDELRALAAAGAEAALMHYGATNTYELHLRFPDGTDVVRSQIPRNDPARIELATRISVELPSERGLALLEAWPSESAEVKSYVEARRYEIHIGVGLFDVEKALAVAAAYEAAHPEVRWGTDHEQRDLEAHAVAPSPSPYQDF